MCRLVTFREVMYQPVGQSLGRSRFALKVKLCFLFKKWIGVTSREPPSTVFLSNCLDLGSRRSPKRSG
jgi:hypothetical protein